MSDKIIIYKDSSQTQQINIVSNASKEKIIITSVSGPQGPAGPSGSGGANILQHTVTSQDIINKYLDLPSTPTDATKVTVDVCAGCMQANGIDFTVSGARINWNSLGMETVISAGDSIVIHY